MESQENTNGLSYHLFDVKQVIKKWLHLDDDSVVDVILGAYIANRFDGDPLWLMVIGPPSNSKTEILRSFDGHKDAYLLSNLTPSTLVSGKDTKNGDPSLLPKLNNKFVILKDFTTILSMRSENQSEIIAQLREIYDGQYSKDFGTGKQFYWKGRIGLIAACTPAYDKHYSITGSLGERFLLYRTDKNNNEKMGLRAQSLVGQEVDMRNEVSASVIKFIGQFKNINSLSFKHDQSYNELLVALACFVAIGRCPVERDYRNQCVLYEPMPEGSARLVKQITQIGIGIALAQGKNQIDKGVYRILKKIGRDQLPVQRFKILAYLWKQLAFESSGVQCSTKDIATVVNTPIRTALLILEDLMVVGALKRTQDGDGEKSPYLWQIASEMEYFIEGSELFEN
jgi:hypothetical protein